MKKYLIGIFAASLAAMTMADQAVDLNSIAFDLITADNAEAIFDAALAATNYNLMASLVRNNKVAFDYAMSKSVGKVSPAGALQLVRSTTNECFSAITSLVQAFDLEVAINGNDRHAFTMLAMMHGWFYKTPEGLAFIRASALVDPCFASALALRKWIPELKSTSIPTEVFNAAKASYFSNAHITPLEQAMMFNWAACTVNDPDLAVRFFSAARYDSKWMQHYVNYTILRNAKYKPVIETILADDKTSDEDRVKIAIAFDGTLNSSTMTRSIYPKLKSSSAKIKTALKLNDPDLVIDALVTLDGSVAAADFDGVLKFIVAMDVDYKPAEVLKGLKTINSRYTLKLYDDRDTWEPILSKVRALIDVRM